MEITIWHYSTPSNWKWFSNNCTWAQTIHRKGQRDLSRPGHYRYMGGPLYEIYLLRWLSCSFSLFWICDEKETQPKCAHAALICNSKSYQNTKKEAAMKFYLVRYLATSKANGNTYMSNPRVSWRVSSVQSLLHFWHKYM